MKIVYQSQGNYSQLVIIIDMLINEVQNKVNKAENKILAAITDMPL